MVFFRTNYVFIALLGEVDSSSSISSAKPRMSKSASFYFSPLGGLPMLIDIVLFFFRLGAFGNGTDTLSSYVCKLAVFSKALMLSVAWPLPRAKVTGAFEIRPNSSLACVTSLFREAYGFV